MSFDLEIYLLYFSFNIAVIKNLSRTRDEANSYPNALESITFLVNVVMLSLSLLILSILNSYILAIGDIHMSPKPLKNIKRKRTIKTPKFMC